MLRFIALIFIVFLAACAPMPQPAALIVNSPTLPPTPLLSLSPTPSLPAPRLLNRQPAYTQIEERQPVITLKFDREMNVESVTQALTVDPVIALSVTAYGGVTMTVETLAPLMPGGVYTFTLGMDATDTQGVSLDKDYVWSYSPKAFTASLTGPTARLAPRPFKIQFNYPVNPASVERAWWITPALSGTLGWNDKQTIVTFTPTVGYEADTLYVIRFDRTSILDPYNRLLPTPAPVSFVSASAILLHSPTSMGVTPNTAIRVQFDRPMDQSSVEAAFHISPTITGTLWWEADTLIFVPEDDYFSESTAYTVQLDPTLRSAAGEVLLRADYSWTFRTALWGDVAHFGYGPQVQVLDAAGRRAVQFAVSRPQYPRLTFELYRLDQSQFLTQYTASVDEWGQSTYIRFNTQNLPLVRQWAEEPARSIPVGQYGDYGHVQETFLPPDTPPGLYVLNLNTSLINDQLLIVLTQHTLVVKQTPDEILAWVTDFAGQPQVDVAVDAYASEGWSLGGCRTDAQGLCRLTPNPLNSPVLVLAQTGDDVTFSGLTYAWKNGQVGGVSAARYAVSIYTDQPVYNFGDTVYFKAIVRQNNDGVLSTPPAGTVVAVEFRRLWGESLRTVYLSTDEFGAVHSLFHLDTAPVPDDYWEPVYEIRVGIEGESYLHQFTVQKGGDAYTVNLTTDAPAYQSGDVMTVLGHVQDAAGEPVAGVHLRLAQYEQDYTMPCWLPPCWLERSESEFTGRTDVAGNVTFYVIAERPYLGQSVGVKLTATADGKWGSALTLVDMVEAGETLALILPDGYFYAPGQTVAVTIRERAAGAAPRGGAPLQVTLNRWDADHEDYMAVVLTFDLVTDAEGQATLSLTVAEPGHYQLRLTGDGFVGTARDLYILAEGAAWPSVGPATSLRLIADRDQYAPGDTASLLIESTFSGPALLTVERDAVRYAEVITLTTPLTRLTLPIRADDMPNVNVTVQAWEAAPKALDENTYYSFSEARLMVASLNLPVPVINKTLTITLTPDRADYAPGEAATFHLRVADANGAPVTAQLSLALTDNRAFALNPDDSASLFSAFYYSRGARPALYTSLEPHRSLLWDESGGCGGEYNPFGRPSFSTQPSAFWKPALVTDANGELTVTVTLPDTLTHWRLTVVAVTMDTQVAEATLILASQ